MRAPGTIALAVHDSSLATLLGDSEQGAGAP
jgi:hypothetical protein